MHTRKIAFIAVFATLATTLMTVAFVQNTYAEQSLSSVAALNTTSNNALNDSSFTFSAINGGEAKPSSKLIIRIEVPHNKKAVDNFVAYPYPVKPPRVTMPIQMLPTKDEALKGQLLSSGYLARNSGKRPYPQLGWRWEYAFNAALRHCGEGYPHSILSMYQWCEKMLPYIKPECQRLNTGERERMARYRSAVEEYKKDGAEAQNEATRNGLSALGVTMKRNGLGSVALPHGTWWIAGARKVPGLIYYWQQTVTIGDEEIQELKLGESNALLIQGAW